MDGYLVIDMSLMCNPKKFVVTPRTGEVGILGQKVLGSIKAGAGCTNAVMLSYTAKRGEFTEDGVNEFEDGGIYMIGSCPSVGIIGEYFSLS